MNDAPIDEAQLTLLSLRALRIDGDAAYEAQKHERRLTFAVARVRELAASVHEVGGVFEPARYDVACTILETHVARATAFVTAAMQSRLPSARIQQRAAERGTPDERTLARAA